MLLCYKTRDESYIHSAFKNLSNIVVNKKHWLLSFVSFYFIFETFMLIILKWKYTYVIQITVSIPIALHYVLIEIKLLLLGKEWEKLNKNNQSRKLKLNGECFQDIFWNLARQAIERWNELFTSGKAIIKKPLNYFRVHIHNY